MVDRLPRMLGADTEVACVDGRSRRYANLDYAASTPALADVWAAVQAFVPWYSSVHRGSGFKSQVATAEYEGAREAVARVRRRPRRTTASCSSATRPRRSTSSRPRCRRARGCSQPRSSTTPTCCRGGATTCTCSLHGSAGRAAATPPTRATARRADRPGRRHRRVQRDRRGVAGRRARGARPPTTAPSSSSTRPSSRRTARSTWRAPASTTSRSPATSSTRRSAPAR